MSAKVYIGDKTYVNVGYDMNFITTDSKYFTDDEGKSYRKRALYIPNQLHTSEALPDIQEKVGKIGRAIISYIIKNIAYNSINITLNRKVLAEHIKCHPDNVSKAITALNKCNLIKPIYKYVDSCIVDTDLYAVNFNHIYKGSFESIGQKIYLYNKYNNTNNDKELIVYFENNPNLNFVF